MTRVMTFSATRTPMLLPVDIASRAADTAPGTSLGPLADVLAQELTPLLTRALPIPGRKARLTRGGGRCPVHGTLLEFDPWRPHAHRCTTCGIDYAGQGHDEWWAMGAQLWTVERAVHAAALFALRGDLAHAELAERILLALADRYLHWPNRDNVLGPTRPFFSTYLESIWLLNACHALALLEAAGRAAVGQRVRVQLLEPSRALIASYPEGASNRQVWNAVAQLSASVLLDDTRAIARGLDGSEGTLPWLLAHGLLDDGSWYEGENYHQFAHRGLWYGVSLMRALGHPLDAALDARFHAGFRTPFVGLLPDETFPSRRDAPYAVSVRQWRFAEWCELGHAHGADAALAALLARLYDGRGVEGDARARSTADAERPGPAQRLDRASLSWRALLMARPTPIAGGVWTPTSAVLPRQGLAVMRREQSRVYVALEGGVTGGGHGHPDRLGLTLQLGAERILDDPGAGSYVERALHWYRSTLAHHAPLVNGASQRPVDATLRAWEDRGGAGWARWHVHELAPGVSATRTVVVVDGYLVDRLEWAAAAPCTITLPIAGEATVRDVIEWTPTIRTGAGGLEDGFDFLRDVEIAVRGDGAPLDDHASALWELHGAANTVAWYRASNPCALLRAIAPGPPGHAPRARHWLEVAANGAGSIVGVWSWPIAGITNDGPSEPSDAPAVVAVALDPRGDTPARVVTRDGTIAMHGPADHGWHIDLVAGPEGQQARSSIDLEGLVAPDVAARAAPHSAPARTPAPDITLPHTTQLGAAHYVPTEQSWAEAGEPTATVSLSATRDTFTVTVVAHTGAVVVPRGSADAVMPDNPLDNERADVNSDGLQWYVGPARAGDPVWTAAALVVPVSADHARTTPLIVGQTLAADVRVTHLADDTGWTAELRFPRAQLPDAGLGPFRFDLVVNERPADRERRRGQLVLSGGRGFGYLRGDRHDPSRGITVHLDP